MKELVVVAVGGALGAVSRYVVYVFAGLLLGTGFPFGTLIVNIVGSFFYGSLLGVFVLALVDRGANGTGAVAGLVLGFQAALFAWLPRDAESYMQGYRSKRELLERTPSPRGSMSTPTRQEGDPSSSDGPAEATANAGNEPYKIRVNMSLPSRSVPIRKTGSSRVPKR